MLELTWLGLDLAGLDALGEDLGETEENFDHEVEVDDNEEIETIENSSQNMNEILSQEADSEVHEYVCYWL